MDEELTYAVIDAELGFDSNLLWVNVVTRAQNRGLVERIDQKDSTSPTQKLCTDK